MYTLDAAPSPQRRTRGNHFAGSSNGSTTSSTSSASSRPSYRLFPSVKSSRRMERRRSRSLDGIFTEPSTPDSCPSPQTPVSVRSRKINYSPRKQSSPAKESRIPQVTIMSPIIEATAHLQAPLEFDSSRVLPQDYIRSKSAEPTTDHRAIQPPMAKHAALTCANVASLDLAVPQTVQLVATRLQTSAAADGSSTHASSGNRAPISNASRASHHTRQASSLSTLDSDDVAFFGSAGLWAQSATQQKLYSPTTAEIRVREVVVASTKNRNSRDKAPTPKNGHDSDSDTCFPPPLFNSVAQAVSKEMRHSQPRSSPAKKPFKSIKSAFPLPAGIRSHPDTVNDTIPAVPKLPKSIDTALMLHGPSVVANPISASSNESGLFTPAKTAPISEEQPQSPTSTRADSPQEPALEPMVLPRSHAVHAKAPTDSPVQETPTRQSSRADPVQRLADLSKQSEALHARYETLRTHRLKLTAAIGASLREMHAGPDYANLLLHQHQSLNATNSSIDICFAKLRGLESKRERAVAILVSQIKAKFKHGEPVQSSMAVQPSLPAPLAPGVRVPTATRCHIAQMSRPEPAIPASPEKQDTEEKSKPEVEQYPRVVRLTSAYSSAEKTGGRSESDTASPLRTRHRRAKAIEQEHNTIVKISENETRTSATSVPSETQPTQPQPRPSRLPPRVYVTPPNLASYLVSQPSPLVTCSPVTPAVKPELQSQQQSSAKKAPIAAVAHILPQPTPPSSLRSGIVGPPIRRAVELAQTTTPPRHTPFPTPPSQPNTDTLTSQSTTSSTTPETKEIRTPRDHETMPTRSLQRTIATPPRIPQRSNQRVVASTETKALPISAASRIPSAKAGSVKLSCEAHEFWDFCEGSFRLSRTAYPAYGTAANAATANGRA